MAAPPTTRKGRFGVVESPVMRENSHHPARARRSMSADPSGRPGRNRPSRNTTRATAAIRRAPATVRKRTGNRSGGGRRPGGRGGDGRPPVGIPRQASGGRGDGVERAELPAPSREYLQRLLEVLRTEVGPEDIGDQELRVGGLPE